MQVNQTPITTETIQHEPHKLLETLTNAGIGTWSFNLHTQCFDTCDLSRKLLSLTCDKPVSLKEALKLPAPAYRKKAFHVFHTGLRNNTSLLLEMPLLREVEHAEEKWICITGIFNPDSKNYTGLLYDVSGRKNYEKHTALFISKLSHELRSPLSTIKLCTQQSIKMVAGSHPGIASFLQKADHQIDRMNTVIEDFLMVSTAEFGKLKLYKSYFIVNDLIQEVLSGLFSNDCDRVVVTLRRRIEIYADREKLMRVLNNYISNALKYSPPDSEITLSTEYGNDQLKINVRDAGIGVSQAEQKKLFQKYYRSREVRDIQGYGIGLFVVREIIEAHHGTYGMNSNEGKGSTFYFTVPLEIKVTPGAPGV